MGLGPYNKWVGGYVEYEWQHVRHLIEAIIGDKRSQILEFWRNFGTTSVVAAILGHDVCAVDINQDLIDLAELNAAQYGVSDKVNYDCITPGTQLSYDAERFDVVLCNSVLEYISPEDMEPALKEIDRVLKPGGVLVTGTSNRLSPREVHSGKWFINYIPRAWDGFFFNGEHPERGLNPFNLMHILKDYKNLDMDRQESIYFKVKELSDISAVKL